MIHTDAIRLQGIPPKKWTSISQKAQKRSSLLYGFIQILIAGLRSKILSVSFSHGFVTFLLEYVDVAHLKDLKVNFDLREFVKYRCPNPGHVLEGGSGLRLLPPFPYRSGSSRSSGSLC